MLSLSICQAYEILMQLALRLPTESTDEASLSCAGTDNDREAALRQAAKQPPGAGGWQAAPLHLLLRSRLPLALPGAEQAALAPAQQGGPAAPRAARHLHLRHAARWRVSCYVQLSLVYCHSTAAQCPLL